MVTTLSKAGKKSFGLEDAEWKWRHNQSQSVSLLWMKELDIQERRQNIKSPKYKSAVLALGHVAIKCGLSLIHRLFGTCQ